MTATIWLLATNASNTAMVDIDCSGMVSCGTLTVGGTSSMQSYLSALLQLPQQLNNGILLVALQYDCSTYFRRLFW
jgi:hypothetical protein